MRKFLIPMLMVSAALPVAAQAQDSEAYAERRAERAEQRAQQREQRSEQRQERRQQNASPMPQSSVSESPRPERVRPERQQWQGGNDGPRMERRAPSAERGDFERRFERRPRAEALSGVVRVEEARPAPTAPTTTQTDRRRGGGFDELRDRVIRDGQRVEEHRRDGRRDSWRHDWRSDRRYDWRRHRDRNRWVFRIGTYYDPYRYSYRRFSIGYNMWPSYYGSRFWINDPWMYRLPPVYGPYRWIRYYDDALLVNIYTGRVEDVIYGVFW